MTTLFTQALLFYLPRVVWLSLEGGLMKFLVRNARGKIIEDAEEKRDSLIVTFKVSCVSSIIRIILVNIRILILLLSKHVKTRYKRLESCSRVV